MVPSTHVPIFLRLGLTLWGRGGDGGSCHLAGTPPVLSLSDVTHVWAQGVSGRLIPHLAYMLGVAGWGVGSLGSGLQCAPISLGRATAGADVSCAGHWPAGLLVQQTKG